MDITKLSIKRPVALTMVILIFIIIGVVSLTSLPLDLLPNMNIPIAIIVTNYSNAGPYEVESMVTKPIESAVATVSNVSDIQSVSTEGASYVIIQFTDGTEMNFASLKIRERIDLVKGMLPDGVGDPMIVEMNMDSQPIASIVISGKNNESDLKSFVKDKIQPRIERLEGVASATMSGGSEREIRVTLDPDKMSSLGLSASQIISSLAAENFNQAGGEVKYGDVTFTVRTTGEFQTADDVAQLPITLPTGAVVRISDIATVEDTYQEATSLSRVNKDSAIILSLQKTADSNIVSSMHGVKNEIEQIKADYPDVHIDIINDQSEFIEYSIHGVTKNLILGAVLAVVVLFIFLKNIPMTAVIGLSIPISVIATFSLIYFSGTTLNMISMGGLALGVGMLVDNAIVVLESIYRYRVNGYPSDEAAYLGTKEVRTAVTASTLTTVVVFLPIVFATGVIVKIFNDMALTVSFSLLSSLLVAITLVPMLCSKLVRNIEPIHTTKKFNFINRIILWWENGIDKLDEIYRKVLHWALGHRRRTILIALACFISSLILIPFIGLEFLPSSDEGIISIDVALPNGTQLENTNLVVEQLEDMLLGIKEMESVSVTVGTGGLMGNTAESSHAAVTCQLVGKSERSRGSDEVADEIRKMIKTIPGADMKVSLVSSMTGSSFGGAGITYNLSGPDMDTLRQISDEMEKIVEHVDGTREVTSSLDDARPEVEISVDRQKASAFGLSGYQVASAIRLALEGTVATTLKQNGTETDIRVSYPDTMGENFDELKSIMIRSSTGINVALGSIADISIEDGPVSISRSNQQRYVSVSCDVFGRDIGSVSDEIMRGFDSLALPAGYTIDQAGQLEMMTDSMNSLFLVAVLAVILVYMVMAAQFESLLYPFVVMFSIPLATTGSLLFLFIARVAVSIPAVIGAIMLVGIVVNNAIVLVDYINRLRSEGMELNEAILKAGPVRLRPILMTALTTILGLLPLMFSFSEGSELEQPLALMVMGGLFSSTMLTLVVLPVLYTYFSNLSDKIIRKLSGKNTKKNQTEAGKR